jgi:hypothetical protein
MTLLDFMVRPDLVEAAWDYFRDVQTADLQYTPFIGPTDRYGPVPVFGILAARRSGHDTDDQEHRN